MEYDVFICHASEDKEEFVRPLAKLLEQQHLSVWYDEFSLKVGDSLMSKIDEGLSRSRFGIVVLSSNFFKKPWTKRELRGLVSREIHEERDVILPIWHRIGYDEVVSYSPPLADKKAILSTNGINAVLRELTEKIRPDESPLVVAIEHLEKLGVEAPPISSEWWLDVIEYKEFLKYPDLNANAQWIFPLPHPRDDRGYNRGMNIASSALQIDWSFEGEELGIGPTTRPEQVHQYLRRWPGLLETAQENPIVLAIYAPQLTIPGFDDGFEKLFDDLLEADPEENNIFFSYSPLSTDDGSKPLCADIVALRHPNFGNYSDEELAYRYFNAHDTNYYRYNGNTFDGLIWLLSDESDWLPPRIKTTLLNGLKKRDTWVDQIRPRDNKFYEAVFYADPADFAVTDEIRDGIMELISSAFQNLSFRGDEEKIYERFFENDMIGSYFRYLEKVEARRRKRNIKK